MKTTLQNATGLFSKHFIRPFALLAGLLLLAATSGWTQGSESFDNLAEPGTSYQDGSFLGQDGSTWTYVQCRGDYEITGTAIMIGRNRTPQSNFYSGTISGGIGSLAFDYMQAFSTNVNLEVYINDVLVGNVTSSGEQGVIKSSGVIVVNVAGNFTIKFINHANSSGQVVVDNVEWTGYAPVGDIPPTVTNLSVSQIGAFSAQLHAEVTSDGGAAVTARGFVYAETSINADPIIDGPGVIQVPSGSDTGIFSENISGLTPGTNYSVKAYATNAEGTSYSSVLPFTTLVALGAVPYTQDFSTFVSAATLPVGWSVSDETFNGDWGLGFSGGLRGNDNVLGYQHTGTTGVFEATLTLVNNTGETVEALEVSYLGRVERTDETRHPEWTVYVDGDAVPALSYSTTVGVDEAKSAIITGLSIANGESFTIVWSSDGNVGSAGSRRQIGIGDVSVAVPDPPALPNPVFDPPSGTYFANQTIFISNFGDYDPSVTIYYTLDGENPDTNSDEYNNANGILLEDGHGPIVLKAIAIDNGDESGIVSAEYVFPKNLTNIAALRADNQVGTIYRLTGEVILTYQTVDRNQKYVQDDTGAVLIDDVGGIITTSYDLYDGITNMVGTLGEYQDMLQLTPGKDPGDATSDNNVMDPIVISLQDLDASHQAMLVRIGNVTIDPDGDIGFIQGKNYDLNDPTGGGTLRTHYTDLDYLTSPIPGNPQQLTGIVHQRFAVLRLVPRGLSDFEDFVAPYISCSPSTLTGFSYEEGEGPSEAQSFLLSGSNLDDSDVSLNAPGNYEISLSETSGFGNQLTLANYDGLSQTIWVRLKEGLTEGNYFGETIVVSGGGAADINVTLNGSVSPPPPGLPYAQDFSGFVSLATLPEAWTVSNETYGGNWGTGTGAGLRGNANVLGFQHTAGTGIFTAEVSLLNNTGETVTELHISYVGRVERAGEGRSPIWTVKVNGQEVPDLSYSTEGGVDRQRTASLTGLNILPGEYVTISWSSDRGLPGGASKQIGISELSVEAVLPPPLPGLPYTQDFSKFALFDVGDQVDPFGEGMEWRFRSTAGLGTYQGDWGDGDAPGFRGNDKVLGYQHDETTGFFTAELKLRNNTGEQIHALGISYTGRVEGTGRGRSPAWTVRLNNQEVPALYYSTVNGTDERKTALVERLHIAPGEVVTISWQSYRGPFSPLPGVKQIGLSDVEVALVTDPTLPVRFLVTDGAAPITSASIFVKALGDRPLITDADGMASTRLRPGSYDYRVYAYTYEAIEDGRFTVGDEALDVEIVLDAEQMLVQDLPFREDYEWVQFPPPLWRFHQLGAGSQPVHWQASTVAHTGSRSAYHRFAPRTQDADNWLVSPPMALPLGKDIRLDFYERNLYMNDYTYSGVWLSTGSGDPAAGDFVQVHESDVARSGFGLTQVHLDDYAGQTVYLAFVYQGVSGHSWWVDDVHVYGFLPEYTVDLFVDPEGAATLTGEGTYARGEVVTIQAAGEPGYDFLGWYDGEGVLFSADAETTFEMPNHALNLTARYELQTFVVGGHAGFGGWVSPEGELVVDYGSTVSFVFTPFEGYEVSDVLLNEQSLGAMNEYVLSDITQDYELKVVFEIRTFTIFASSSEGGSLDPEGDIVIQYFGSKFFTVHPDSEFHEWTLWVDGDELGQLDMYVFEEVVYDRHIHVDFTIDSYTITAEAGFGGVISPMGPTEISRGGSQIYRITPNPGFHVQDVLVDGESVGPVSRYIFEEVSSDHQIQALFERNRYTITATASPGGNIDPVGEISVEHGSAQGFNFTPDAGSYLLYVEVDGVRMGAPDKYVFPAVTRNHRIHAQFAYRFHEVSLRAEPSDGGRVIGSGIYPLGWNVSVLAIPQAGYRLDRWTDDAGNQVGSSPMHVFTMPDEDVLLTAHFVPRTFELTLSPRPAEGGSVEGGGSYAAGEQVLLMATAAQGYAFVNWTAPGGGVVSQEASFTYTMPAVNIHLRANFSATGKQETMAGGMLPGMHASSLRLYPNPVGDVLHVESESAMLELRLYDLMGRQVYAASPEQAHYHQLAVGGLPGGIYLIRALTSDGWTTGRVQVSAW